MLSPQERKNRPDDLPFVIPLTRNAMQDIQAAQKEAKKLNHRFVGTEHLLLELIKDPAIKETFLQFNIDPNEIPSLVEQIAGNRVRQFHGEINFSLRFKEVVKFASQEANACSQQKVTRIDLLIGVVREEYGVGAKVLKSLGLTKDILPKFKNTYLSHHPT